MIQYLSVPKIAWNFGIIDRRAYFNMTHVADQCVRYIREGKNITAGEFCEQMVATIYEDIGGGVFRYDVRTFYDVFGNLGTELSNYLNSPDVQAALHTTGTTWTDSDETGPVADALRADFVQSVVPQLEVLLNG